MCCRGVFEPLFSFDLPVHHDTSIHHIVVHILYIYICTYICILYIDIVGPYCMYRHFLCYHTAPGSVSNIIVLPSADATAANISWDAAPLFDANTDITYAVVVYDTNGTVVWSGGTTGLEVMVTGLGKHQFPDYI